MLNSSVEAQRRAFVQAVLENINIHSSPETYLRQCLDNLPEFFRTPTDTPLGEADEYTSRIMEFHSVFGAPIFNVPTIPNEERAELRLKLMREELDELEEAFVTGNLVDALDALADLQVVLSGTVVECGMQYVFSPAFRHVHESNMSKRDEDGNPILREDGKILKGPNYWEPELLQFVEAAKGCDPLLDIRPTDA